MGSREFLWKLGGKKEAIMGKQKKPKKCETATHNNWEDRKSTSKVGTLAKEIPGRNIKISVVFF